MAILQRIIKWFAPADDTTAVPSTLPTFPKDVSELAVRLGVTEDELKVRVAYRDFRVSKRSGGSRLISAPSPELKRIQRRILKRLLRRLHPHSAATGFEPKSSIVHNALCHTGAAVIVRLDIKNFFTNTKSDRIRAFFSSLGWNTEATNLLTRLCTYNGCLPQGAPTSPRLSNLVNYALDMRLSALAKQNNAIYTRYTDDMTFSIGEDTSPEPRKMIAKTRLVAAQLGYEVHTHCKLRIRRQHERQLVTGLVVNDKVNLPRKTRRWLRAVEHYKTTGRPTTLTREQLDGWRSFRSMVEEQAGAGR